MEHWRYKFECMLTGLVLPEKVDAALEGLLEMCVKSKEKVRDIEELLDTVLLRYQFLRPAHLRRICDILFCDTISFTQVNNMKKFLEGPNGTAFRDYIMQGFSSGYENGVAQYHFCAAAIWNSERGCRGENALDAAVKGMLNAEMEKEFLMNTMCLGMIAWNPEGKLRIYQKQIEQLKLDQGLINKLCSMLRTSDKRRYSIVASTVHDLVIREVLNQDIFDEQMCTTAIRALADADLRKRAEALLTLIPVRPGYKMPETANRIADEYRDRLLKCLQVPDSDAAPENFFAVLCHLNAWSSAQDRWEMLNRVCDYYITNSRNLCEENMLRLNTLLAQFKPGRHFWPIRNTDVSPEMLYELLTETELG